MNKPNRKDYHTDSGLHAAMQVWANSQAKSTLSVSVTFDDSPEEVFRDTFERVQVEKEYKTLDGETYTVSVDSGKYKNTYMPGADEMSRVEIKAAFVAWVQPKNPNVKILSLVWKVESKQ